MGQVQRCRRCNSTGHNVRTCPAQDEFEGAILECAREIRKAAPGLEAAEVFVLALHRMWVDGEDGDRWVGATGGRLLPRDAAEASQLMGAPVEETWKPKPWAMDPRERELGLDDPGVVPPTEG